MGITRTDRAKDLLEKLHHTNGLNYRDTIKTGVPENYSGRLVVISVDENLTPIEGSNKVWWACKVKLQDGSEVLCSVLQLIVLRGQWRSNKLSERATELEGKAFQISEYKWTPNYVPPNGGEPFTRKVFKGKAL